jgi:electron transfer flavoprotein alpha subunit
VGEILVAAWPGSGLENGRPTRAGLEQLGAARAAAGDVGSVTFVAFGPGSAGIAAALAGAGVRELVAVDADLDEVGTDGYLEVLDRLAAERKPEVIVLFNDARGREVGPRLAARLGGTAINDVVAAVPAGGRTVWSRPCFGGKAVADVVARRQPVVVTIRPRAFAVVTPDGGPEPATTVIEGPTNPGLVRCEQVRAADRSGARLEDARVIVAGGRGLGDQEAFDQLGELATLLGGMVGASLAAVDEGWAKADQQVGLTGKVVSPELYIAVGISGASQHIAGLAAVKTIVAINSDSAAPIFQVANLGAVLDARQAIPALIAELRRRAV